MKQLCGRALGRGGWTDCHGFSRASPELGEALFGCRRFDTGVKTSFILITNRDFESERVTQFGEHRTEEQEPGNCLQPSLIHASSQSSHYATSQKPRKLTQDGQKLSKLRENRVLFWDNGGPKEDRLGWFG